MDQNEERLKNYIRDNHVIAEHLRFEQSCHSVAEAAEAAHADPAEFVKNICLLDAQGKLIVAIVKGEDKVSTTRVGKLLGIERPLPASPEHILGLTGYPCGGTPSFGYNATYLVDERVMEMDTVYSGGGSEYSLTRLSPQELVRANGAQVLAIRK